MRRIRNRCRTLIQINLFNFTAISPIAKLKVELTKKLILVNLELRIGETIELKRPFMVLGLNSDEN